MKKIAIITIDDINNYGNRLQNYAVQQYLNKLGFQIETLSSSYGLYYENITRLIKHYCGDFFKCFLLKKKYERYYNFRFFNRYIKFSSEDLKGIMKKNKNKYDYYIVGSDQVWNPYFNTTTDDKFLMFIDDCNKKISFSASIGVDNIPENFVGKIKSLSSFKSISVRENRGKELIEKITSRTDVEVLIDPTMLLSNVEWDCVSKKPKQLNLVNNKKYILNYFLGSLSELRKKEIERVAKENDCYIINILDKNDPFYQCGPSEFLYLEKHAFLICTDSFHSSVFAILYDKPFIVFEREDKEEKMNSRLDTLLSKFKLLDRKYNGKIVQKKLEHDYSEAYKILEKERIKVRKFIEKALDIK